MCVHPHTAFTSAPCRIRSRATDAAWKCTAAAVVRHGTLSVSVCVCVCVCVCCVVYVCVCVRARACLLARTTRERVSALHSRDCWEPPQLDHATHLALVTETASARFCSKVEQGHVCEPILIVDRCTPLQHFIGHGANVLLDHRLPQAEHRKKLRLDNRRTAEETRRRWVSRCMR
jgi:hypothetical protein